MIRTVLANTISEVIPALISGDTEFINNRIIKYKNFGKKQYNDAYDSVVDIANATLLENFIAEKTGLKHSDLLHNYIYKERGDDSPDLYQNTDSGKIYCEVKMKIKKEWIKLLKQDILEGVGNHNLHNAHYVFIAAVDDNYMELWDADSGSLEPLEVYTNVNFGFKRIKKSYEK